MSSINLPCETGRNALEVPRRTPLARPKRCHWKHFSSCTVLVDRSFWNCCVLSFVATQSMLLLLLVLLFVVFRLWNTLHWKSPSNVCVGHYNISYILYEKSYVVIYNQTLFIICHKHSIHNHRHKMSYIELQIYNYIYTSYHDPKPIGVQSRASKMPVHFNAATVHFFPHVVLSVATSPKYSTYDTQIPLRVNLL